MPDGVDNLRSHVWTIGERLLQRRFGGHQAHDGRRMFGVASHQMPNERQRQFEANVARRLDGKRFVVCNARPGQGARSSGDRTQTSPELSPDERRDLKRRSSSGRIFGSENSDSAICTIGCVIDDPRRGEGRQPAGPIGGKGENA